MGTAVALFRKRIHCTCSRWWPASRWWAMWWLLLTAVLFALSAVCYAIRLATTRSRATERSG